MDGGAGGGVWARNCNWRRIGVSNLELSSFGARDRGARSNRLVIRTAETVFPAADAARGRFEPDGCFPVPAPTGAIPVRCDSKCGALIG